VRCYTFRCRAGICGSRLLMVPPRGIRRIDQRLGTLELQLSDLRLTTERTGWEPDPQLLQAEIVRLRARLADLCDDENAEFEGQ
jgi:hypothetical protein